MERQAEGYVRLETHMDIQAIYMRLAELHRQLSARLEAEAKKQRQAARS